MWECCACNGSQSRLECLCALQSDWNVVKRGWEAHVLGEAPNRFQDPVEALKALKARTPLALRLHPCLPHRPHVIAAAHHRCPHVSDSLLAQAWLTS